METLQRLEAINGGVDWDNILQEIELCVGEYNQERANSEPNPERCLQGILPDYWQVVHTHNTHRWVCEKGESHPSESGYHVGIFLVGYSSLPIVLSLVEIQPREKIYFLHSQATGRMCDEITARIEEMMFDPSPNGLTPLIDCAAAHSLLTRVTDAERLEIADPSDPVATFKLIKEIINDVRNELGEDKRIALDLTGGKKTMIGGGFTAGSIWSQSPDCDMFYVDSEEYNIAHGVPKPGTEFLSRLENPYDIYNVQTIQRAEELFSKHNYEAAANLWEDVEKKLQSHVEQFSLEDEQKAVQSDLGMANCYRLWDAFDYKIAKNHKVFSSSGSGDIFWGYNEKHTHNGIDVLDILSEVSDRETLFKKKERVIHYAVDRYQNAIRRKESGKLDDAIVRFAQVIEMICIYEIKQIAQNRGLFSGEGDQVSNAPHNWKSIPLIQFLFGCTRRYEGSRRRSYRILDCHHLFIGNYDCGEVGEIIELIEFRHDFVHFSNYMDQTETEENAQSLKQLARKFLENAASSCYPTNRLSFDELLDLHKFRLASLSPVEQLVEELNTLTCSPADEGYAAQIYNEKLQSFEGKNQQMIAAALKAYWKRIDKWEGPALSVRQRGKVKEVESILNNP